MKFFKKSNTKKARCAKKFFLERYQNGMNRTGSKFTHEAIDKIITYLGKANDSEVVTAILACFKLIFMPMATMSDEKTSKEQKEYAIKRDFLTECTALGGYIGITKVIKNSLSAPVCSKYYKNKAKKLNLNKDEFELLNNVNPKALKNNAMAEFSDNFAKRYTAEEKAQIKKLEQVTKKFPNLQNPKELYLNTKKTISHLCVCLLALSVIPFVTNKLIELEAKKERTKRDDNVHKKQILNELSMKNYIGSVRKTGGLNVFNR